jgi:hypothetical protein
MKPTIKYMAGLGACVGAAIFAPIASADNNLRPAGTDPHSPVLDTYEPRRVLHHERPSRYALLSADRR